MNSREAFEARRLCPKKKGGEYNMLKCVCEEGHKGDCVFVVDHDNDYPRNSKRAAAIKEALK